MRPQPTESKVTFMNTDWLILIAIAMLMTVILFPPLPG